MKRIILKYRGSFETGCLRATTRGGRPPQKFLLLLFKSAFRYFDLLALHWDHYQCGRPSRGHQSVDQDISRMQNTSGKRSTPEEPDSSAEPGGNSTHRDVDRLDQPETSVMQEKRVQIVNRRSHTFKTRTCTEAKSSRLWLPIKSYLKSNYSWIPQNFTWTKLKPVIRCALTGWVSIIIFVIPKVEIMMGNAGFLILIGEFNQFLHYST